MEEARRFIIPMPGSPEENQSSPGRMMYTAEGEMTGSDVGKEPTDRYEQALRSIEDIRAKVADNQRANEFEITFRLSLTATFLAMAISLIPILWDSSWGKFSHWPWPIISIMAVLIVLGIANAWWRWSPFRRIGTWWLKRKVSEANEMTTKTDERDLREMLEKRFREEDRRNLERLMEAQGIHPIRVVSAGLTLRYATKGNRLKGIRLPKLFVRGWSVLRRVVDKIRNPPKRQVSPQKLAVRELALISGVILLISFYIGFATYKSQDKVVLVGGAGALGTVVLALITYLSVVEMRNARKNEIRPIVVPFTIIEEPTEADPYPTNILVVVKNFGKWPAIDIMIDCSPPFPQDAYGQWTSKEIVKSISVLPPEQMYCVVKLSRLWAMSRWDPQQRFSVRVAYKDPYGELYSDSISLDFEYVKKAGW